MPLIRASQLVITLLLFAGFTLAQQSELPLRGDVSRYLIFLQDEQQELEFQVQHGEITRPYYRRASDRLNILKSLVTRYGHSDNLDPLPEYYVIPVSELDNFIPAGRRRLRMVKPREVINGRWRFLKVISRSENFYVFERITEPNGETAGSMQ